MTNYLIADIHGNYDGFKQLLDTVNFNTHTDSLIILGDIVDGGYKTRQCINLALSIPNMTFIAGNHDCIDKDTEILTNNGWKSYHNISPLDMVFSYDIINDIGVWQPIEAIIIKQSNTITNITTRDIDMGITKTHNLLCQERFVDHGKQIYSNYKYINHTQISSKRLKFKLSSSTNYKDYDVSDNIIKLTAWILTDGCISKPYKYISIYQSKPQYIKEITDILNNLNISYTYNTRNRDITHICNKKLHSHLPSGEFHIHAKSSQYIHQWISEKVVIPPWINRLSDKQFLLFLHTLIKGDGTFFTDYRKDTCNILYGSYEFLNNIQAICITKGVSAILTFDSRNDPRLNISFGNNTSEFEPYYHKITTIPYNGMVYCIQTPLHNFMIRRNGKHHFTGNCWFLEWAKGGPKLPLWTHQGGYATLHSYDFDRHNVPLSHIAMIQNAPYYLIKNNSIFVHGGFDPLKPIEQQTKEFITWDRDLILYAKYNKVPNYKNVYVGHTSTQFYGGDFKPIRFNNLIMCDTGGGWNGKLTLIDLDTPTYHQTGGVNDYKKDNE